MSIGKRNRSAGFKYERDTAKLFREELGFIHTVTSRSESRSKDNKKIDIMNKDESVNGKLPFSIQCKNTTNNVNYDKLIHEMPDEEDIIRVIFHKKTEKIKNEGKKAIFRTKDEYAILRKDDFIKILKSAGYGSTD